MASMFQTMDYTIVAEYLGISLVLTTVLMSIILVWTLVWKGLALWKSARRKSPIWFIIFLVVNTVGILEILYIFVFSKMSLGKSKSSKPKKKSKKRK
jgi:hypothetical protein